MTTEQVTDIGNYRQLFLDERLCAQSHGIRRVMNTPASLGEPVLELTDEEKQQGLDIGYYCSLRQENGLTRLWYFANSREDVYQRRLCYAESEDGLNFSRPSITLKQNEGLKPRNAVLGDPIQGGCVWVDPNAPPHQRYRTQAKWGPSHDQRNGYLNFYASPDGIQWENTHQLAIGDCDTQTVIFFDDHYGRYVMYTRAWLRFDDHNLNHRRVRRLESNDLITWSNERIVWEVDAEDLARYQTSVGKPPVDCYGACVFKVPDAGDFYIILAQHFWHWQDRPEKEKWGFSPDPQNLDRRVIHLGPATIDARLGYSRDGIEFLRAPDRGPFLGVGPDGRFDSRGVWILPNPVFRQDDIRFYYTGANRDHDGFVDPAAASQRSAIGLAVMRRDGFVSVEADRHGGRLTTPALRFSEGELLLNVAASGGGCVKVEVLDANSRPIKGFSGAAAPCLCGDSIRMPVRWTSGAAGQLAGQPVRFKFHLTEAKLYSFQIAK